MTNKKNDYLIDSEQINQLLYQTKDVLNELQVSAWSIIESFFISIFDIKKDIKDKYVDFSKYKNIENLEILIQTLKNYREETENKYKKLHYTYIISKVKNRINEIKINKWKKMSDFKNFLCSIRPWDIMLIGYESKWFKLNTLINNFANSALKYFSKSIFAHVWIIWYWNFEDWYSWIHSTLNNEWWRTWVKEVNLEAYLNKINPTKLLVARYNWKSNKITKQIVEHWLNHVNQKTNYNTRSAIWDLFWLNIFRKDYKFNCGDLVYDCLKAIDPKLNITKSALPSSYLENKKLEQEYITFINKI